MKTRYIQKIEMRQTKVSEKIFKFTEPERIAKSSIVKDELLNSDREKFMAICLNTANVVTAYEVVSIGSLTSSIVHPRESYKLAIKSNACSIIFVHNHPSGNINPSNDDIAITKRLVEAGKILGIRVLDHIIVGGDKYFSFSDENLI